MTGPPSPGMPARTDGKLQNGRRPGCWPGSSRPPTPRWTVRPVRRRGGTGLEAVRDQPGLCSLTGTVTEVRAALAAMTP